MLNLKEFFSCVVLTLLFEIINHSLILPCLRFDLFFVLPVIFYPIYIHIKTNRKLSQIVQESFIEMGYSIVSEKTFNWKDVLYNELKYALSFNGVAKRFYERIQYLDEFLRIFEVEDKGGKTIEISVKIIMCWTWQTQVVLIPLDGKEA